jgi:hypothetical protein
MQGNNKMMTEKELDDAILAEQAKSQVSRPVTSEADLDDQILAEQEKIRPVIAEAQGPTLESDMGFDRTYSLLDNLKYLDKARSTAFALSVGPMMDAFQGKSPYENMNNEYQFEPSPTSSFTGRLRGMFPNQKPLMDTPQQDVSQGENLKATAKLYAQKEFPKAYGFLSNAVPSDVVGNTADMMTGSKINSYIPTEKIIPGLKDSASYNRARGLLANSEISELSPVERASLAKTKKLQDVGDTLLFYGIADEVKNPVKLSETLNGPYERYVDKIGRPKTRPDPSRSGLIEKVSIATKKAVAEYQKEVPVVVDIKRMAADVVDSFVNEGGKNSLNPISHGDVENLIKNVNDKIGVNNANSLDGVKGSGSVRTLTDLIDMKRSAADFVYNIKNNGATYGVSGVNDLKIYKKMWEWIDAEIDNVAIEHPELKKYLQSNQQLSHLLTTRDLVAGATEASMSSSTPFEAATMAGVGLGAGSLVGHPVIGASLGGAFGAAKGIAKDYASQIPSRLAGAQQGAAEFLANQGRQGANPFGQASNYAGAGTVVNVPTAQQQMLMNRFFVENLAEFKIPRTVQGIMDNKKLVLAKVAQVSGSDNRIVETLQETLEMHPDLLGKALPALMMRFPMLFQLNKYQSWVDGHILDPMEAQKAYKDVQNNAGLSQARKTILQSGLNRDGSFPESL